MFWAFRASPPRCFTTIFWASEWGEGDFMKIKKGVNMSAISSEQGDNYAVISAT